MLNRCGATAAELVVSLTLASIVLGSATSAALRQQRSHSRISGVRGVDAQLNAATMMLAGQLASLEPSTGDITPGSATDTALQFRATVAAGIACDSAAGGVVPVPASASTGSLEGDFAGVRVGDTLWWVADSVWRPTPVNAVLSVNRSCSVPPSAAGPSVRLAVSSADTVPPGAPLRVTRQTRYGIYRSGDGSWQLGFREWSPATNAFAAPQPVAGPLLRSGARASRLRYYDRFGSELSHLTGPVDVTRIARIRISTSSVVATRDRTQDSIRTDSVDVALRPAP